MLTELDDPQPHPVPDDLIDEVLRRGSRRRRRRRVTRSGLAFALLAGVVVVAVVMLGRSGVDDRTSHVAVTGSPADVVGVLSRASLTKLYSQPTPDFPVVGRVEVKKMLFRDVWSAAAAITGSHSHLNQSDAALNSLVYVVLRTGESHPENLGYPSAAGHHYQWDVIVVSATDGVAFLHFGTPDASTGPALFANLPDLPGK
jgi:hypothetical protein